MVWKTTIALFARLLVRLFANLAWNLRNRTQTPLG